MRTSKSKSNPAFVSIPTQAQSEAEFRKKIKKPTDGANAPQVEKFLNIMARVRATMKSFSIDDVAYVGRAFDLTYAEIKDLLTQWTDVNVRLGRVDVIQGVYDQPTIIFI